MNLESRFQAVLFDLDGTLVNTLTDLTNACNLAITDFGCQPLSETKMKDFIGFGAKQLVTGAVRESFPDWTWEQIEPVYITYRRYYKTLWKDQTTIYPGLFDLLTDLKNLGVKLAVISNKPHDSTVEMVNHYFPAHYFDSCYGQLEPWPVKPDPALAIEIARQLDVSPAKTALVGDSGSDMATAIRAGMSAIGVLWGFREAADLQSAGDVALASDVTELRQLLFK